MSVNSLSDSDIEKSLQHYYTQIEKHSSTQEFSSLSLVLLLLLSSLFDFFFFSDAVNVKRRRKSKVESTPTQKCAEKEWLQ